MRGRKDHREVQAAGLRVDRAEQAAARCIDAAHGRGLRGRVVRHFRHALAAALDIVGAEQLHLVGEGVVDAGARLVEVVVDQVGMEVVEAVQRSAVRERQGVEQRERAGVEVSGGDLSIADVLPSRACVGTVAMLLYAAFAMMVLPFGLQPLMIAVPR